MKGRSASGKTRNNGDRVESSKSHQKRMEDTIEQIHRTVIKIENVHGAKIDALGEGLSLNNARLDRIEKDFNQRFNQLQNDFYTLGKNVNKRFDEVDKRFDGVDKRFDGVDKRFDGVDKRFDRVEKRVDHLEIQLTEVKNDVSDLKNNVTCLADNVTNLTNNMTDLTKDVKEIKHNVAQSTSIASDHESRLGVIETSLQTHLAKHP